MSVIVTVDIPAENFALGEALTANPGIRVQLERVIPLGSTFIPYFWASDDSIEDIEEALRSATDLESFEVVDTLDEEALVRVEWEQDVDGLLDAIAEADGTILEGVGENEVWTLELRFPDHDALTGFYRQCNERGIDLDLKSVHNPGITDDVELGLGMTDVQRETLQIALEKGYFDVPRRINLVDLAAELDLSDTAVSQRLRRGITTVLSSTLADEDDESTGRRSDDERFSGK